MTLFAAASVVVDPAWPWSEPHGVLALGFVALLLAGLTIWTYLGTRSATLLRIAMVVGLRLAALAIACLLVLRPSFAQRDDTVLPSKLLILADSSTSMNFTDEFNNQSRWQVAVKMLRAPAIKSALEELQQKHKVEVVLFQGAEDVRAFDPESKADGKRTDIGQWLHELRKRVAGETSLRGLVLLSDGADNGTRYSTTEEASLFRGIPCPIHSFLLGSPTSTLKHNDLALVDIQVDPNPVPVKSNQMKVKVLVNAPGFVGHRVTARLFIDDKQVAVRDQVEMKKLTGNEIELGGYTPDKAGEIKVTVKLDKADGEVTTLNNEISTYATVTKEGVSILWVEGKERLEPTFALRALASDPRFSVYHAKRLKEAQPTPATEDLFDFKKKHYDVIVIGDVSASRFSGGRPEVFRELASLVKKGTGLVMLGGYETFGNSDWQAFPDVADLLPVDPTVRGQVKEPVRLKLSKDGEQHYLLRLGTGDSLALWKTKFEPLDGMTRMLARLGATVLAWDAKQNPVLVTSKVGEGRVLAFAGDTTYKAWQRDPETAAAYRQFWKQLMLWLARQDEAEGNVFVKLDARRFPAGSQRVGFTVGVRGKEGAILKEGQYKVKVTGPTGTVTEVPTGPERSEERGYFAKTAEPGEYTIEVVGTGKESDGQAIQGTARGRFIVYAEDLENLRPAADHEFLRKLAQVSGGQSHMPGEQEMLDFLNRLKQQESGAGRTRADIWPDWRRTPVSDGIGDQLGALWASGALLCFFGFVSLLGVEWVLRRRWGMV